MNAHEHEFALKIVRELDRSTRSIDNDTVAKLATAREQALAQYQQAPAMGVAVAGRTFTQMFEHPTPGIRYALSLAVLILGLAGIVYWQSSNGAGSEIADLDARLLTDDLPIDAYLDKGFDSWLKRQQR
ncbi:MAG: hypothetical protein RLZZ445_516 [Pseudomonadota bacterium]|jgi:hypothetical protein